MRWTVSEFIAAGREILLPFVGQEKWTPMTRVRCLHCDGVFAFGECRVDEADGMVECANAACDASLLDLFPVGPDGQFVTD